MLASVWDWIKDHFWLSAGILVGIVIVWRLMTSEPATAVGPPPSAVEAGHALQALQIQAQAAGQQTQAQLEAALSEHAAQIAIADMARQLQEFQTGQAAAVALAQIEAEAETVQHANTLEAAVATQTLETQRAMAELEANALAQIQASNAAVQQQLIASNQAIQQTMIQSNQAAQEMQMRTTIRLAEINDDDSLWDTIF